jgi:hypothetical protein
MQNSISLPSPFTELRRDTPLAMAGMYLDASLFLVLSGPSLKILPLEMLSRRGVITMGVNNSPAVWRPHLWTAIDSPGKFHSSIWRDPGILKFVPRRPVSMVRRTLREKTAGGFRDMTGPRNVPCLMPGAIGMDTNQEFSPAQWLGETSINCGNSLPASEKNGLPHCVSVFFAAIKLAWTLGFRTIYLLGCDFVIDSKQPYAFPENKTYTADPNSDQSAFARTRKMMELLAPLFPPAGLRVFNCNPDSRMDLFPSIDFKAAIAQATASVADQLDTVGWYRLNAQ